MSTQAEHKILLGHRYSQLNVDNQRSTADYPLIIPQEVFAHARKFEDRPFIGIYTKYNDRARLACEALLPLLAKHGTTSITRYLDIGCGTGAISALVAKLLKAEAIYLIDGAGEAPRMTGFTEHGSAWNDVFIAMAMVRANVPNNTVVGGFYASQPAYPLLADRIGLITSFRSWGHHYHVEEYVKAVKKHLGVGGLVMLDIRNGTNGKEVMQRNGFHLLDRVPDTSEKCQRLLYTRT